MRRITKPRSVTEKTLRKLREAIISSQLMPGQALVIESLAKRLGVSRTPVREAILMLEKEGLVEVAPGHGAFVSGLSLADLVDLFELRCAIERHCLWLVSRMEDRSKLYSTLRLGLEAHLKNGGPDDVGRAAEADLSFHRSLVAHTKSQILLNNWDRLASQLRRFWVDGRSDPRRIRVDIESCLAILAALEESKESRALDLLQRHLDDTKAAMMNWHREILSQGTTRRTATHSLVPVGQAK